MVVVYVGAGLANRMFQYAFALSLKQKEINVAIDESTFKPRWNFEDTMLDRVFLNIDLPIAPPNLYSLTLNDSFLAKLYKKISCIFPDYRYVERWKIGYDGNVYTMSKPHSIYVGFWISEKYFDNCKDDVVQSFQFKPFVNTKNKEFAEKFKNENSIAVHFRKNLDYLKNNALNGTCTPDYYNKAIEHIKAHVKSPVFYFFSDNWDWVNENIKGVDYIAIDWNPVAGEGSHCDMQLMSLAKHNIIANSTYSWWSAWLNINNEKIVIAPKKWFGIHSSFESDPDIIPTTWLKI